MNIENLKNMPVVGQPAQSGMEQIATAILDAGTEARDFIAAEEAEMELEASQMAAERAKTHESNAESVAVSEKELSEKYDALKEEYTEEMNKLIAFITDNSEQEFTDSIGEGLRALQAADAAMDNSFLRFNEEQNDLQGALESEYGSSADVAAILGIGFAQFDDAKQLQAE